MGMRLAARAIAFAVLPPALLLSVYLALAAPSGGVTGGLTAAAALSVYVLMFGPAAAAERLPPRALLAIAAAATIGAYAAVVIEAAGAPALVTPARNALVFVLIAASAPAALTALFGRAHALRKTSS